MAKTKGRETAAAEARKRATRKDPSEVWTNRLVFGGVLAVIALVIGLIAFGYIQTQVRPLGKTVLVVGDIEYDLGHLERRMSLLRESDPLYSQDGEHLLGMPDFALEQLEREAFLIEGSTLIDITVSELEIDSEIRQRGGIAEEADAEAFAQAFRAQVDDSGLRTSEYRQMIRAELLQDKVREYFLFLGPQTEDQVRTRWLVVADQEAADGAIARLDAGEEFEAVVQEFSEDPTASEGGLVEWRPRGIFPSLDIERFLFDEAQVGDYSEAFDIGGQFYVIQLIDREEERELDEQNRAQVAERDMAAWISSLRGQIDYERSLSAEDASRALQDVLS